MFDKVFDLNFMPMRKYLPGILFILPFIILNINNLKAQGELDKQNKILFSNERTFGLKLKSSGWEINYRYAKRTSNYKKKWFYTAGFGTIKDPKEIKSFNEIGLSGSRFVYGKTNSVFKSQASIGRQRELFTKFDKGTVSIRIIYAVGVGIAFMKPIYYNVYQSDGSTVTQLFALNIPSFKIRNRASFFKGLPETIISPGVFAKVGASFEYGKKNNILRFIETGATLDFYPKKIKIMETENSRILIPSVYVSWRFGKVISDYHLKEIE